MTIKKKSSKKTRKTSYKYDHYNSTWTVKLTDNVPTDDEDEVPNMGYLDPYRKVISIHAGVPHRDKVCTLVHELLHKVWPKNIVSHRTEERLIALIEEPLYDALFNCGLLKKNFSFYNPQQTPAKARKRAVAAKKASVGAAKKRTKKKL